MKTVWNKALAQPPEIINHRRQEFVEVASNQNTQSSLVLPTNKINNQKPVLQWTTMLLENTFAITSPKRRKQPGCVHCKNIIMIVAKQDCRPKICSYSPKVDSKMKTSSEEILKGMYNKMRIQDMMKPSSHQSSPKHSR